MIQKYTPYTEWEDWINGMWRKLPVDEENEYIEKAILFTGNHLLYGAWMKVVINVWPCTMLNSMTNVSINRRAFLGHCACSLAFDCPEYITRIAWHRLTEDQRMLADRVAQEIINKWVREYEEKNRKLRSDMGTQMLFEWYS